MVCFGVVTDLELKYYVQVNNSLDLKIIVKEISQIVSKIKQCSLINHVVNYPR